MMACNCGFKDVVKILLDHRIIQNIDINTKDIYGQTVLITASENGNKDIVKILLDHPISNNIDINAKNNHGRTALMVASITDRRGRGGRFDIVKMILEHPISRNIDFTARDNSGRTVLQLAKKFSYAEIYDILYQTWVSTVNQVTIQWD